MRKFKITIVNDYHQDSHSEVEAASFASAFCHAYQLAEEYNTTLDSKTLCRIKEIIEVSLDA